MSGDGQVTFGNAVVMKHTARKVRKSITAKCLLALQVLSLMHLHLFEKFEAKLEEYNGNLQEQPLSLQKNGEATKFSKLEAMFIVMNKDNCC